MENKNLIQPHEPGNPEDWVNHVDDVVEGGKRFYTVYLKRALGVPYCLKWDFDNGGWHDERGKHYLRSEIMHRYGVDAPESVDEPKYIAGSVISPGSRFCPCDSMVTIDYDGNKARYCPDCGAVYEALEVREQLVAGSIHIRKDSELEQILDARREQGFGGSL